VARVAEHRAEERQPPRARRLLDHSRRPPVADKPLARRRPPGAEDPALARRALPEGPLLLRHRPPQRALRTLIARGAQQPPQAPRGDPPTRLLHPLADQPAVVVGDARPPPRRRQLAELTGQLHIALDRLVVAAEKRRHRPVAAQLLVEGDDLHLLPSALQPGPPDGRRRTRRAPSTAGRTGGDLSGHRWGVSAGRGHALRPRSRAAGARPRRGGRAATRSARRGDQAGVPRRPTPGRYRRDPWAIASACIEDRAILTAAPLVWTYLNREPASLGLESQEPSPEEVAHPAAVRRMQLEAQRLELEAHRLEIELSRARRRDEIEDLLSRGSE
jgi:hypothetical protein